MRAREYRRLDDYEGEEREKVRLRGLKVTVLMDHGHTLTGTTQAMPARLSDLADNGVTVLLCRSDNKGCGIQHSKTLQCDRVEHELDELVPE